MSEQDLIDLDSRCLALQLILTFLVTRTATREGSTDLLKIHELLLDAARSGPSYARAKNPHRPREVFDQIEATMRATIDSVFAGPLGRSDA